MSEPLVLERATLADLDSIRRLLLSQFDEHEIDIAKTALKRAISKALEDERLGIFVVARREGELVGLAAVSFAWTLEHGGKTAWLDELYVRPEHRMHGVGTALLREVMSQVRILGCAALELEVDRDHRRAEGLYEREGFRPLARSRWVKVVSPDKALKETDPQ
jgi:GNAT superfamily N-acetyltransferase